jgi:hypothetical protein
MREGSIGSATNGERVHPGRIIWYVIAKLYRIARLRDSTSIKVKVKVKFQPSSPSKRTRQTLVVFRNGPGFHCILITWSVALFHHCR